jgi:signal transduction histidine kinase
MTQEDLSAHADADRLQHKIERAVAAERARLARDLHDEVTQTLSAASLIADVLPQLWARDPAEGARRLEELRRLTRGALAELRALLLALRPTDLIEMPFGALLQQLADAVGGRAGVPITVALEPLECPLRLAPELQIALYHIAQEALHNAARHARAARITLACRLELAGARAAGGRGSPWAVTAVTLRVADDGAGFDPRQVAPGHLGLSTMRERAQAVGARLELASAAGQGTAVTVRWEAGAAGPDTGSEVSDEREPPDPGDGR